MTNNINMPTDLIDQKRMRRILDIICDSVIDEVDELATAILAENGIQEPDPNNNIEYDRFYDEVHVPVQEKIWDLIGSYFGSDPNN